MVVLVLVLVMQQPQHQHLLIPNTFRASPTPPPMFSLPCSTQGTALGPCRVLRRIAQTMHFLCHCRSRGAFRIIAYRTSPPPGTPQYCAHNPRPLCLFYYTAFTFTSAPTYSPTALCGCNGVERHTAASCVGDYQVTEGCVHVDGDLLVPLENLPSELCEGVHQLLGLGAGGAQKLLRTFGGRRRAEHSRTACNLDELLLLRWRNLTTVDLHTQTHT